jgi:hypothetical protein
VLLAAPLAPVSSTAAQTPAAPAPTCTYRACALVIAPRWNGLAVVRAADGRQVANLHFFWPRDVSAALAGPEPALVPGADSAAAEARRAVRLRRVGAVLTDGGILLGAVALVRAVKARQLRRSDGLIAVAGAATLGVSIPVQFAADGALSRAVWWHNARYAP